MVKKIVMVAALLAVGVAIALYLRRPATDTPAAAFTPRTDASEGERIADLEKALAAQVDRGNLLESRLKELEARLGTRGGRRNADPAATGREGRDPRQFTDADGNFDPAKVSQRNRERRLERLVEAGFSHDRAEAIDRRVQELQVQEQQARFDAQRNNQPYRGTDIETTLRKELGDADYEKYLTGTGRPTSVRVMEVLASSAAEKAGLKPGDQIVSYAGQRVFDNGDLTALTRQGAQGEAVTVEVLRDGQTVQLSVPRGMLGVQSGGGGRRGGFNGGAGGPGGFGGGGPPGAGGFGGGGFGGGGRPAGGR
jgi:hypothetical protein